MTGASDRRSPSLLANPDLERWITILPEGRVLVRSGKVELGQGTLTALARIVALELGIDPARIEMVPATTDVSPDEGFTAGSLSVSHSGSALREAARSLRDRIPPEWLSQGAPDEDLARLDIPGKVFGSRRYVHDLRLPDQAFGRVLRPPSRGARLIELDEDRAQALAGVIALVRQGDFLGVVCEREDQAVRAVRDLAALARWDDVDTLPGTGSLEDLLTGAPTQQIVHWDTAVAERPAPASAATGRFLRHYLAHGSIGPSCAVAQWLEDHLRVWSHTQGVYPLRAELARWFGLPAESVTVQHVESAGCYGHNGADDVAGDAALLARAVPGRPVQVVWTREDEFGWAPLGGAMCVDVRVELGADGRPQHWQQDIFGSGHNSRPGASGKHPLLPFLHTDRSPMPAASDSPLATGGGTSRNGVPAYDLPGVTVVSHLMTAPPLRTSALRSLGAHLNVFAIESVVDELAEAGEFDPLEYRLSLLSEPRAREVLQTAADAAGWAERPRGGDIGYGIGYARYKNYSGMCAVVAEVQAQTSVQVRRLTIAVDVGAVVSVDGVRNQIEGGALQALSWTLKERVTFDRHHITSLTWEDYPILRFDEVPDVEVLILDRRDEPSVGAGEAAMGPTAAAIGNAVADCLGIRVRTLPITPEQIIAAIDG